MSLHSKSRLLVGGVVYLFISSSSFAAGADANWNNWLVNQIETHPELVAARESMNAALSAAEGSSRALYNPELETGVEREGDDNNFSVGFKQTVDWRDKRGTRTEQAESMSVLARQGYELKLQEKLSSALQTLVTWDAAREQYQLAQQQEEQLDTLIALVKKRQRAGDLGQIDVELTLLSLSQKLYETAEAMAQFKSTETRLREMLPAWSSDRGQLPEGIWNQGLSVNASWVESHPKVQTAKAQWKMQEKSAELARLNAKADPTFGVTAGRNGDDSVTGLNFSIPLNFRNNYSEQVRAASQEATAAQALYEAKKRGQQFVIEEAAAVAKQYQKQFMRWQSLMADSRDQSKRLLDRQWRTGDLSTSDYLLALQQRMEGLSAGIRLREQYRLATLNWLESAGQVTNTLTPSYQ